jgi:hypothetical protein
MPTTEDFASTNRHTVIRYGVLTAALFIPLLLTFASARNLYPFAASTMMLGNIDLQSGREYYKLRGETIDGRMVDVAPIQLTDALSGRNWSLADTAVRNRSFIIRRPHPDNVFLLNASGGFDKLPTAARLEQLLRAWGNMHNSHLPDASNLRLRSISLDLYRWEGGLGGNYGRFIKSWTVSL